MQRQVYEHMHSLNNYGSNAYCSRGLKIMPVYQGKYFGKDSEGGSLADRWSMIFREYDMC